VINTLTPTLQWNASPGADYYALAISKYPYGPSNVIYRAQQVYGTSHTVPASVLQYGQKYRWNMQAYGLGGWSSVSNTLYFQTECSYSISPANQSFDSTGGSGSVNVTAGSGCFWTASSNAGWITITSGSRGNGNGAVNYSVASNPTMNSRTGTMMIAGQTFTVTQDETPPLPLAPPILEVMPNSLNFGDVIVGQCSADQIFTMRNSGGGTLSGSASVSAPFSIASEGSFNLGVGQTSTVVVRFCPTIAGQANGTVNFTSNGGNVSRSVTGNGALTPPPVEDENDPKWLTVPRGQLTFDLEGTGDASLTIHWPKIGNSGVTIGRGYDIGQRSSREAVIADLTAAGIPSGNAEKLARAAGLKGSAAKDFVQEYEHETWASITRKQQWQLFNNIYKEFVKGATEAVSNAGRWGIRLPDGKVEMYPSDPNKRRSFDELAPDVQDVAVDMAYNVGSDKFREQNWGGIFQMDTFAEMADYIEGKIEGDILTSDGKPTGLRAETILASWRKQVGKRVEKLVEVLRGSQRAPSSPSPVPTTCPSMTVTSSPSNVTYTKKNQTRYISVTITNSSGASRRVTAIEKQSDERFTIVSITPSLPQEIANGRSQNFTIRTRGPATGPFPVMATNPYFDITVDCGTLTTARETHSLRPFYFEGLQTDLGNHYLRLEVQGMGIDSIRLQLFDFRGLLLVDHSSDGSALTVPLRTEAGGRLANGVYLYVVRMRGFNGEEYVSQVRKLVILR